MNESPREWVVFRVLPATVEEPESRLYLCYNGREADRTVAAWGGRTRVVRGPARRTFKRSGTVALVDKATADAYAREGCGVMHGSRLPARWRRG